MAATKTTTITALAGNLVVDPTLSTSSQDNVTGNSSGTFYLIDIDNTANASTFAYVRIRDASSADPAHASNGIPTWQFVAPPATKTSYAFPDGQEYSAGLSMWCSTNPAHQNTTAPGAAVIVKLVSS
jgi:hypothetical protein